MKNIAIIESFADLKNEKFIDRPNLMIILENVLKSAFKRQFSLRAKFDIIMNPDNGDVEIWRNYDVVDNCELEDKETEIEISQVHKIESDFEIGEEYSVEIKINQLDRRNILFLKQNLKTKLQDFENISTKKYFTDLIGEIYSAEVYLIKKDMVILIDDYGNEILLPKGNQIPGDFYKKGDSIRGIVESVEIKGNKTQIVLSRTANKFLEKLFEIEIPDVMDGLITIKKVVRIPGQKAKIAVESYDDRIDAVGSCVGLKGSRIKPIIRELNNEFIDVINWCENKRLFITRSLEPAKVIHVELNETNMSACIDLNSSEIPKAIGIRGSNIKLASMITGFSLEIQKKLETDESDVSLLEFKDEVDDWIINEFLKIGLDTAKSVLKLSPEYLQRVTDLEVNTIEEFLKILKTEFQ